MKRMHVFVSGRVQGVFFRAETERVAREHGLTGWVRNMPDGRVEAVFEGNDTDVDAIVAWCRRGPKWSEVGDLEVAEEPLAGGEGFRVR
jgi:acylphosphatase